MFRKLILFHCHVLLGIKVTEVNELVMIAVIAIGFILIAIGK